MLSASLAQNETRLAWIFTPEGLYFGSLNIDFCIHWHRHFITLDTRTRLCKYFICREDIPTLKYCFLKGVV